MRAARYSIYALRCPVELTIKYVGSSQDLKQRYLGHIQNPRKATRQWIASLKSFGQLPIMEELESGLTWKNYLDREKYWVLKIQSEQGGLLNIKYLNGSLPNELPINYLDKK